MSKRIGAPSVGGMKESLIDYALGAGGGIVYAISTAITGSGLIGGLAGAALAGSIIKGTRGTVIATVLGFQTILGSLGGGGGAASADAGTM
jgi:hypothetical protein